VRALQRLRKIRGDDDNNNNDDDDDDDNCCRPVGWLVMGVCVWASQDYNVRVPSHCQHQLLQLMLPPPLLLLLLLLLQLAVSVFLRLCNVTVTHRLACCTCVRPFVRQSVRLSVRTAS